TRAASGSAPGPTASTTRCGQSARGQRARAASVTASTPAPTWHASASSAKNRLTWSVDTALRGLRTSAGTRRTSPWEDGHGGAPRPSAGPGRRRAPPRQRRDRHGGGQGHGPGGRAGTGARGGAAGPAGGGEGGADLVGGAHDAHEQGGDGELGGEPEEHGRL